MSAPSSTVLFIVPTTDLVRAIAEQAPPTREGVRVVVCTPSFTMIDHVRGTVFDTVIVMPGCRSGPWDRLDGPTLLTVAKGMHRGNGPWIELDSNYRNEIG